MRETIQELIQQFAARHADNRLHHFRVNIESLDENRLVLSGHVLEAADLNELSATLSEKFQPLRVDAAAVEILRKPSNPTLAVGTNLTSVHVSTSFGVEVLSQMVYGEKVEMLAEQGKWIYCRQMDGYLGWTFRPYLSDTLRPEPTHIVLAPAAELRSAAHPDAPVLTRVLSGTRLLQVSTQGEWAQVAANMTGWMHSSDLRALADIPKNEEDIRAQMLLDAQRMIGVPYLWGGVTGNGIDCSGFARLLHSWVGLDIPRDADMQSAQCRPIDAPCQAGDLFFFGEGDPGSARKITHVGVCMGGWKVMHSSRSRNGVYLDDIQENDFLRSILVHAGSYIRA